MALLPNRNVRIVLDNVIPYLIERGYLAARDIVEGDCMADDASSRHANFCVRSSLRQGLFLKHARPDSADPAAISSEASFYESISRVPSFSLWLPSLIGFEREDAVLVLELLEQYRPLNEAYRDFNSGWLSEIARSLASALSVLHTVDKEHASFRKALCINEKPWILQVSALTPAILGTLSAGNLHFLHIIQNDFPTSELCAMRDIWQIKTLIHGDIKSSNIMISTKMDSGISALKLVDWEFWSIGDPAWDIGGVLHDWFLHWVWATVQGRTDADVFIDNIKRAGAQFVQSYTGASIEERHSLFVRSIKMCAMRLLQSVFEQHQTAAELTKVGILSMQLSANLLSDPMAGSRDFLGR